MLFQRQTRREMLQNSAAGFGMLGLAGALEASGGLVHSATQIAPRAKRVIFLFMNGGPSHVDTFDPKPALKTHEGKMPEDHNRIRPAEHGFLPSPFKFRAHGRNGVVMSELLPHLAQCADDLCVLRGMHTDVPNHEPGLLIMNSGHQQPVRPSFGSWASYGLGSENANLPAFVVLSPGHPVVGPQLWSNGFLPGQYQGTSVDTNDMRIEKLVANLSHPSLSTFKQRKQLDLIQAINRLHAKERQFDERLESNIRAMELAFNMQAEATDAFDISQEPTSIQEMYGDTPYAKSCLLARRLSERGVRFVQVYYVSKSNKQPWDTHFDNNGRHRQLCKDGDQASAALIKDLKQRGLLEDTLVVWGGEFGRTPYAQIRENEKQHNKPGRDHHHTGFSMFLAGGGVKGGFTYGATDEVGMNAVAGRMHVHDLHATLLYLMGINHEKLTYRYSGRDFRLTDVYGRVVNDIIA